MKHLSSRSPAKASSDMPPVDTRRMKFKWLSVRDLWRIYGQWRDLAEASAKPNPDYGPDIVLAYARSAGLPEDLRIASVWSELGATTRLDALGFYVRHDLRWAWPVRMWVNWNGPHFDSSEPLIRKVSDPQVRRVLFDGLSNSRQDKTLVLSKGQSGSANDPMSLLSPRLEQESILDRQAIVSSYQRAAICGNWDLERYLAEGISGKFRQNVRRSIRKLESAGALRFETITENGRLKGAIEDFLALEMQGWKGRQGSALACDPRNRQFADLALNSGGAPKVACDVLSLDGKAIAANVNLITGDCLFGFKSAFDDAFRKFSPGNIAHYFAAQEILRDGNFAMADSSSLPGNPIESIWPDRVIVGQVLQSVGAPISPVFFDRCLKAERLRMRMKARSRQIYNSVLGRKVTAAKRT